MHVCTTAHTDPDSKVDFWVRLRWNGYIFARSLFSWIFGRIFSTMPAFKLRLVYRYIATPRKNYYVWKQQILFSKKISSDSS